MLRVRLTARRIAMRLLLVEDDAIMAEGMCRGLAEMGHAVEHVDTAEDARLALEMVPFDLAIIDIGLPDESGISLVRGLRRAGNPLPVLIVTARDSVTDRVDALDLGADDYLVKPFSLLELAARCRAVVRRISAAASSELAIGDLRLHLADRSATLADAPLALTPREWAVLECLAIRARRVVPKERLLAAISGWDRDLLPNTVEALISRLRTKLGDKACITTLRGFGYRLDDAQ